ncbi:Aldo/keto reductase [Neolentinus lepideus HHB14362 ss-1]|uniref:Aldo/keto reductase n=1 Tax=Neolentinus lepideus HHB14362 ss-1 TaxID=1314782 RepID=A0A165TV83_9AGAM|nr:Aldo/keto reductase [Neolentinus lepideus HHB14362 ss-1]
MAADIPVFTLNDGTKIPSIGMGCWMGTPGGGEKAYKMCQNAIKCGYRHFDTAFGYANEEWVGRAIRESGIPRGEIYLTTKLPNHHHHKVKESFEESIKALDCGYVDLYLMHWPQSSEDDGKFLQPDEHPTIVDTWKEMEKLLETGKVKTIGVSNFSIKTLTQLLADCDVIPATNQVELHPCLPSNELKAFCESKGIVLTAYSPLGRPTITGTPPIFFNDKTIASIAQNNSASPAQIIVSWGVQRGTIVVPKSENVERMKANITLVKLSAEDMQAVDNFHKQPGMHRSLLSYHNADPGRVFGWTYADMGWDEMKPGGIIS